MAKAGASFDETVKDINEKIGVGVSFDIIFKEFTVSGRRYATYFVNGFGQDLLQLEIIRQITQGGLGEDPDRFLRDTRLSYPSTTTTRDVDAFILEIFSGPMGIVVEGSPDLLILDTRSYPERNPSEPDTERVITGPRDGFVETILFNVALVRRRMRDPNLRAELVHVGEHTKIDVAVAWIEGYTSPALVEQVKERVRAIRAAGVTMAEEAIEENIGGRTMWDPFPKMRITERPDVVAENLMEGRVAVFVDTSPMVILLPVPYLSHIHSPEDYHVSPANGTFLRWVTILALLIGTWVTPLWLVLATHPIPALKVIGPSSPPTYPLVWQFIAAEVGIDIIRRAILSAPSTIATAMSILAAVILGQLATKANIFTPEVLVYSSIAAVALFAVPSIQLGMAHRLVRISLIVLTGIFGWYGLIGGSAALFAYLSTMTAWGIPYLWPLIPFDFSALASILIREPLTYSRKGPRRLLRLNPRHGGGAA